MKRLVIATHNAKKAGEMRTILGARFPALELLTLADFPGAPEPEETGDTYADNAVIKAESAFLATGLPCVADDAGLEIDALPGELGPLSKRFEGENTTFAEKMSVVLARMREIPDERRGARFRCFVAFRDERMDCSQLFEGICEGRVARSPAGDGGFGYDPVFWLPELGCTMAQLTPEGKHAVSHRGKVLKAFSDWLAAERLSPSE